MHNRTFCDFGSGSLRCDEGMTETDAATDRFSLVPGAHRLIRAIDSKEGPFAGTLVTHGEGVAVCVAADRLTDWPGWAYADAEHVCGVVDVRRRSDGHDVLLPWCTARVESFLGRRQIADAPLVAGELGTLVASVLRGVRELGGEESGTGDWWLTADGRPVFVHGDGGAPRARSAAVIERAAQHTPDRATARILDEVVAALRGTRHHVDDERRWEDQLFAIAAPRALRLDVFAPERVSEIGTRRVVGAQAVPETRAARRRVKPDHDLRRLHELASVARQHASSVVARFSRRERVSDDTGRRFPRRRSMLLAASLGVTVLVVGLMWPSGGPKDDAEAASRPTAVVTPPASEPEPPVQNDEALTALPALLDSLRHCVDTEADICAGVIVNTATMPSAGVVLLGADASSAVVVEDYGDVVVVRLTPVKADSGEQMLVLERQKELWLLRDVYDVAKQPE